MVYVILAPGFEELEALTPVDILRRAKIGVTTVGLDGKVVTGSHGIPVTADVTAAEADLSDAELVVLPGGLPGAHNLDASDFVTRALADTYARGGRIAAICAAPLVLGHRGYLEGKRATCFPGFEGELHGATPTGLDVVTDGRVTTGKCMEAAMAFALELRDLLKK